MSATDEARAGRPRYVPARRGALLPTLPRSQPGPGGAPGARPGLRKAALQRGRGPLLMLDVLIAATSELTNN